MADIDLRVPVFDFDTGEFVIGLDGTVKTVTGSEAVGMIAVKAEETERGVFPVYGDFENEEENKKYIFDNILHNHQTLPIGEFAIGTNTTAYAVAKKYDIADKYTILIAEKTGPHFAVGDTCYSWAEDVKVYNPDGKEIIARDNSISILRKEDPSKAYFQCHTDITIPYDELGSIVVVAKDGTETEIIRDGRFVLPGTEILNEPLN
mgnify:CR=1 FL=1